MTMTPFITKPHHYAGNYQEASKLRALPAIITQAGGREEPGVVVLASYRVKLAMNERQALNLATAIADALDYNRTKKEHQ